MRSAVRVARAARIAVLIVPAAIVLERVGGPRHASREPVALGRVDIAFGDRDVVPEQGPWRLRVMASDGRTTVLEEAPPDGHAAPALLVGDRWVRASTVRRMVRDSGRARFIVATEDPGLELEVTLVERSSTSFGVTLAARPSDGVRAVAETLVARRGERYFGLGARFGPLDARGTLVRATVEPAPDTATDRGMHLAVPFFVSTHGYGVAVHGTTSSRFDVDTAGRGVVTFQAEGPTLEFTVWTGSPLEIVAGFARSAGPAVLPPPWAFRVWKTTIGGEQRVLEEVARLRRSNVPVSVLWIYDLVDQSRQLGWERWVYRPLRPGRYPDPRGFVRRLKGLGYRVLGYVSPEFAVTSPLFTTAAELGYFVRDAQGQPYVTQGMQGHRVALLDFTNPDAAGWWSRLVSSLMRDLELDGWMQDGGDGAPLDAVYASGAAGRDVRNRYPLLYATATRRAVETAGGAATFMRAGFTGIHGVNALFWPCDAEFSWSNELGLPAALRAVLNGSVSGIPFWASEIGGYWGCGPTGPAGEELWIRWLQVGALHPVMRDHLGDKCRNAIDAWTSEATRAALRAYAALHDRLAPYLVAVAVEAAASGRPPMRPVVIGSPDDSRAQRDEFTYLLGDDLVVAPVVYAGARTRTLYLPPGAWIDWWTGRRAAGPDVVTVPAPLERIPLFVRAGSGLHAMWGNAPPR